MAHLLESKNIVTQIKNRLLDVRKQFDNITLVSLKIAADEATEVYVQAQKKWADSLGIEYRLKEFSPDTSFNSALQEIERLNQDRNVNGIIIHKPLPSDWDEVALFENIDVQKDIEGLNPHNLGRIFLKKPLFLPPTVLSVIRLIKAADYDLRGKNALIVGFSAILGKPLSIILADKLATVSIAHIGTYEAGKLCFYVQGADILITAVGKPHLIKGEWIKPKAMVIDVGISKVDNKLIGDVEFEQAYARASFITPVPGGVGTLTVACLFDNLLRAVGIQEGKI